MKHHMIYLNIWPRGGMVTQRIANPSIPVRFWAWPPKKIGCFINLKMYVQIIPR